MSECPGQFCDDSVQISIAPLLFFVAKSSLWGKNEWVVVQLVHEHDDDEANYSCD
jgi:hypothetical protein